MIILELFLIFLQIWMLSFGGGYAAVPLIKQHVIIEKGLQDVEYIKDDYIQPYVWKYQGTKKMYYLLVADRSKGDDPYLNNTQGGGNIWRYNEKYDLLLARKI